MAVESKVIVLLTTRYSILVKVEVSFIVLNLKLRGINIHILKVERF